MKRYSINMVIRLAFALLLMGGNIQEPYASIKMLYLKLGHVLYIPLLAYLVDHREQLLS